jgi:hypothetical protein
VEKNDVAGTLPVPFTLFAVKKYGGKSAAAPNENLDLYGKIQCRG